MTNEGGLTAKNTPITRRAIARGALWATPAMVVSSAAPAFADSTCVIQNAKPVPSNSTRQITFNGSDGITVTGRVVGGNSQISNNNLWVLDSGEVVLEQDAAQGEYQEVLFEFSKPVYNLQFVISDIDNDWQQRGGYTDAISVSGDVVAAPVASGYLRTSGNRISAPLARYDWDSQGVLPKDPKGQVRISNRPGSPVKSFTVRYENLSPSYQRRNQVVLIAFINYTSTDCTPS
ncbi:hypothetical protein KRX56_08480 [Dermabacteraceae bacterium TAE3-ERU27]|nr:hypothetical protein [Dermabacteraceae bacterium TAE3-ERU27]